MKYPEVIAHRGVHGELPENSISAFERAMELGADGIEFDVRLTADSQPIVYHYYYLQEVANAAGPIFNYSLDDLKDVRIGSREEHPIPTLSEVLQEFAGKCILEIEIKGPEPESASIIAEALMDFKSSWQDMEVTSFEPALLRAFQSHVPEITVDLLVSRNPAWMQEDVLGYASVKMGQLAGARAVHLHPTQLSKELIQFVLREGMQIHSYDVNNQEYLDKVLTLEIPRFDTEIVPEVLSVVADFDGRAS
jgi:glycerophosphoryl diester phosphodiesterase